MKNEKTEVTAYGISENTPSRTFPGVSFLYPFRDYQARVLAGLGQLLDDNRVHVAAAPGAGKTILGLEIIRRLNKRALILVPTINLRNQWKERFLDSFIDSANLELRDYWEACFSLDLRQPGIITCSTYQALYSLYKNVPETADADSAEESRDESSPDLSSEAYFNSYIAFCREAGIGTICLDEAHHLKREWWKALTTFVGGMQAHLIALTATPPMDTSDLEWKRYCELCGDIDMEISIPEMVVKKCLCPHQDYLYICNPTDAEEAKVEKELERNRSAAFEILRLPALYSEIKNLPLLQKPAMHADVLLKYPSYLEHLLSYAVFIRQNWQVELEGNREAAEKAFLLWDRQIERMLEERSQEAETPCDDWFFLLMKDILENDPASYSDALRKALADILTNHHLMKNGKLMSANLTESTENILRSSASKLDAIVDIIRTESAAMGSDLRCLILMDHIRREDLSKVASEESLTDLGVSTVFERIRRQEHLGNLEKYFALDTEADPASKRVYRARIGVLTGSLVILPDAAASELSAMIEGETGKPLRIKSLAGTGYASLEAGEQDGRLVSHVTQFFRAGRVEILIGTSALLGEGWDCPAVNTLIIGSTSSMYVKTNQMRGRALRITPEAPEKVSNIWHLSSVSRRAGVSSDLQSIRQRFDVTVGLSLDGLRVENGLNRLKTVGADMDQPELWNSRMKECAANRRFVYESWSRISTRFTSAEVRNVVEPPAKPQLVSGKRGRGFLKSKQQLAVAEGTLRAMRDAHLLGNRCTLRTAGSGFYIEHAAERESRAYASCLRQALSPLVSPKYMIRFGIFMKKYVPVPAEFSARADSAELYRKRIRGAKKLIPVNTPEGKNLLLRERLHQQTLTAGEARIIRELT